MTRLSLCLSISHQRVRRLLCVALVGIPLACGMFFGTTQAQTIHFDALPVKGGKEFSSSCVVLDSTGQLASVVGMGADKKKATLTVGDQKISLIYVANDINSRVAIYKLPDPSIVKLLGGVKEMGQSLSLEPSSEVFFPTSDKKSIYRVVGRVTEFQGKVLPLAVIRINHTQPSLTPGSGIYDKDGKLQGIVRQPVFGVPGSSYCLPVEVVARTLKDHQSNGCVRRCWIGIVMDELVDPPIVESVRPGSPASKAGLKKGDVILSIGQQKVGSYSEVVDAFFYLISGEATIFKIIRGTELKEMSIIPEASP